MSIDTKANMFDVTNGPMPDEFKRFKNINKFMVIDDKVYEIHDVVVHTFRMGDVEDPDLYAGEPLWQWQQSEIGKWVMQRSMDTPVWHRIGDPMNYGYVYRITAKLKGPDYTYWVLKYADTVKLP
jgi:hypothetical protein